MISHNMPISTKIWAQKCCNFSVLEMKFEEKFGQSDLQLFNIEIDIKPEYDEIFTMNLKKKLFHPSALIIIPYFNLQKNLDTKQLEVFNT